MTTQEKLRLIRGKNGMRGVKRTKKPKDTLAVEIEEFYRKTPKVIPLSTVKRL